MHKRRRRALIAGVLAGFWAGAQPALSASAEYLQSYVWTAPGKMFGGFSGLDIDPDGKRFYALSDRVALFWGVIERDETGRITGIKLAGQRHLKDSKGRGLPGGGYTGDSEGLAVAPDGSIYISFEGLHRVMHHLRPDAPGTPLPRPDGFDKFQRNSGMEALAIDAEGALWTLPERSGKLERPFPVWRFKDGKWDQPFTIPRNGNWLPTGADFGPDGKFYLLERDFWGVLGFLTRVRRFDLGPEGFTNEEVLIETFPMRHDNLEGIAVWRDDQGTRLTMISDDNFFFAQRTELVEYRIRD